MLYHEGGKLIVAEEEIAFGELPEAAQKDVNKRYGGGDIELSEKITRDSTLT